MQLFGASDISMHFVFVFHKPTLVFESQITLVTLQSDPSVHHILVALQVPDLRDFLSTERTRERFQLNLLAVVLLRPVHPQQSVQVSGESTLLANVILGAV